MNREELIKVIKETELTDYKDDELIEMAARESQSSFEAEPGDYIYFDLYEKVDSYINTLAIDTLLSRGYELDKIDDLVEECWNR